MDNRQFIISMIKKKLEKKYSAKGIKAIDIYTESGTIDLYIHYRGQLLNVHAFEYRMDPITTRNDLIKLAHRIIERTDTQIAFVDNQKTLQASFEQVLDEVFKVKDEKPVKKSTYTPEY